MVWTLEFDAQARKMLRKLPNHIGDRIISALVQIIERGDPRDRGGAMTGTITAIGVTVSATTARLLGSRKGE